MAFEHLAAITNGAIDGSDQIEVSAVQPDGTEVLVYAGWEYLGAGEIDNSKSLVITSRPVHEGEQLTAYVTTFGEKSAPAYTVTPSETYRTGWMKPEEVNEQAYEAWLLSGGQEIPSIYDPRQANTNRVVELRNVKPINNKIGVTYELRAQYGALNQRQVIASVLNVTGLESGALYQFDSNDIANINSNTYLEARVKMLKLYDAADIQNFVEIPFTVTLPGIIPEPTGVNPNIKAVGYTSDANIPGLIFLNIVALGVVEVSIDGVSSFSNHATTWVECVTRRVWGGHTDQYVTLAGCPLGARTLKVRLKATPAQQVSIGIYI